MLPLFLSEEPLIKRNKENIWNEEDIVGGNMQ